MTVTPYTCVEGTFLIACNGWTWTMSIYKQGANCQGNVLDTLKGNLDCAGSAMINCQYVAPSSALGLVSGHQLMATLVGTAVAALYLLR